MFKSSRLAGKIKSGDEVILAPWAESEFKTLMNVTLQIWRFSDIRKVSRSNDTHAIVSIGDHHYPEAWLLKEGVDYNTE